MKTPNLTQLRFSLTGAMQLMVGKQAPSFITPQPAVAHCEDVRVGITTLSPLSVATIPHIFLMEKLV